MTLYLRIADPYGLRTKEVLEHWHPLDQFVDTSEPRTIWEIITKIDRYNFVESFFTGIITQDHVAVKAILDDLIAHGFVKTA